MAYEHITIKFEYSLKGNSTLHLFDISPDQYFDLKYLDEGEELETDSIALFWNDIDYLDSKIKRDVSFIKVDIFDSNNSIRTITTDSYWNDQNYLVRERVDYSHDEEVYHTVIISLTRTEDNSIYEIIHLEKQNGILKPVSHTIAKEGIDGNDETLESYIRGVDKNGNYIIERYSTPLD
jgi:hypothetical protein